MSNKIRSIQRDGAKAKESQNGKPEVITREVIAPNLLALLGSLNTKAQLAKANYEAVVQEIAMGYQLGQGDTINLATGVIAREKKAAKSGTE